MTEPRPISEFIKNNQEIVRISLIEAGGPSLCDIRIFADIDRKGERRATRKGICLKAGLLPVLIAALQAAEREASR